MNTFKLQKIDESLLSDHSCLEATDHCFFFGIYTARQGYGHSEMNQLIWNFKKPMKKERERDWPFKQKAINQVSKLLLTTEIWPKLKMCTWVPIPPAYAKDHSEYDDRMLKVLEELKKEGANDIRELLYEKSTREQSHIRNRRTITDHLNNITVDQKFINPSPKTIVIFDDVITSGASFKAAQILLKKEFPEASIIGVFIARNVSPPEVNGIKNTAMTLSQ